VMWGQGKPEMVAEMRGGCMAVL